MLPKACNVVSPEEFDKFFRAEARIAEFASVDEEAAYAKRVSFLTYLIRKEAQHLFGKNDEQQLYIVDDWWPDHTRYIEATPAYCTATFFTALRCLLTDDYKDYRIQICVYGDLMDGKSYIGSMVLFADRVLIEKRFYELLQRSATVFRDE